MSRERTIEEEIADLAAQARRLDWESRCPRACPREAYEAEEKLRVTLEKLADLRVKLQTAQQA